MVQLCLLSLTSVDSVNYSEKQSAGDRKFLHLGCSRRPFPAMLNLYFYHLNMRIMKLIFLSALVATFLFVQCGDPEITLKIKGKVLDEKTKVAIPHKAIIVQALVQSGNSLNPVYARQILADSSGCFSYSFRKVKNAWLYDFCFVGDSDYAYSTDRLGVTELKRYGEFLTFTLHRLTDFTIRIERKTKAPARDTLFVSWDSNGKDGKALYPYKIENFGIPQERLFIWIGGNVKSTIRTKAFAEKKTIVNWKLFRNGRRKEYTDTIFCIRNGTNYVNFKY
jgi:hypothetical protein